jgi:hypothetical protein
MSRKQTRFAAVAATLILLTPSFATAADNDPSVAIEWNQAVQATIGGTGGPLATRWYASMHIAMFDAVNSITREYTPFRASVPASSGASLKAAAAQAAFDVIWTLMGGQPTQDAARQVYEDLLEAHLAGIAPGPKAQGIAVGHAAAAKILQWRLTDGATTPGPAYSLPLIAGLWQSTGTPAALTHVPFVVPFTLKTNTQFLPRRFP